MRALARRHPDALHFSVRGYATAIDVSAFLSQVGTDPNIEFGGAYQYPDDLPAMHAGLHFVWGFDFSDATANSRWLLPNRLYESGLYHVPMLAAAGTETGRRLAESSTGAALEVDATTLVEGVSEFFASLTPEMWHAWRGRILDQPRSTFTGEADYEAVSDEIARACERAGI
jgi:succinoglycan biosynthesis protein ExoL